MNGGPAPPASSSMNPVAVASNASGTNHSTNPTTGGAAVTGTQTRFSFYNAQDFVTKSPENAGPVLQSSSSKEAMSEINRESVEILRSLQEHEQQRMEILGQSSVVHAPSPTDYVVNGSEASNPYEDAIKEALDLLRKHRTTAATPNALSAGVGTHTSAKPGLVVHTAGLGNSRQPLTVDTTPSFSPRNAAVSGKAWPSSTESIDLVHSARTPPESDYILQSRGQQGAIALGEAYQAEIEARRKQRQERMARYAHRLAELKQEDRRKHYHPVVVSQSHSNQEERHHALPSPLITSRSVPNHTPRSFYAATASTTPAAPSHISGASEDEVVQRGVERVLLAILERANHSPHSRVDANPSTIGLVDSQRQPEQQGEEKKAQGEEDDGFLTSHQQRQQAALEQARKQKEESDALVRAVTDLLGSAPSTSALGSSPPYRNQLRENTVSHLETMDQSEQYRLASARPTHLTIDTGFEESQQQNHAEQKQDVPQNEGNPTMPSQFQNAHTEKAPSRPVDAEINAHQGIDDDDADELDQMVRSVLIQDTRESSTGRINEDSLDRRVRSVLSPEDEGADVEADAMEDDDEVMQHSEEDWDDAMGLPDPGDENLLSNEENDDEEILVKPQHDHSENDELEGHTEEPEDEPTVYISQDNLESELDGVLGPLNQKAGGITGVVLESDSPQQDSQLTSPSILDSLSAAMSLVTGTLTTQEAKQAGMNADKYSTAGVPGSARQIPPLDEEADELMRTLCAHLLPPGVSQATRLLDQLPEWDETNPDEAGYRIIRLTTRQLTSVEYAWERMMMIHKVSHGSGVDESFERDLQEAEELLDREEQRQREEQVRKLGRESSATEELESLRDFPGVKPTGRGEMGDLEFFNLPIIFKSHVTGFEPTKDLVLESGNVVAGQYLVEGELGSAAFSTAYRCVDLNSEGDGPDGHDEVCLKVIKNTKDFFDQSLDEIKILELLRQTGKCAEMHLVEMRTFFYHREHLVIVTELLRQNLFEFGKYIIDSEEEPYFTMMRLSYITRQVLVALDFVHKLGLVHSDIKPENILLSSYSRAQVKVIDFGSSCFLTDRQSSYIQSRSYRAPEVILGLPYDGKIDVWSLGCVVAEMYTGEVTFQNDSIVSMLSRIEAICGCFPSQMIANGRQSGRFFAKCGLLYERVSSVDHESDNSEESDDDEDVRNKRRYVDIFQPKITTLSARLGFSSKLMAKYDNGKKLSKEETRQAIFVDFVRKLLTIDPDGRPTAEEALQHPWMLAAGTLAEEDIKYPAS